MHTNLKFYYFIENFNLKELSNIKKSINIIFRNYHSNDYIDDLIKTRNYCKKKGFKLYLSNNINLAIKLRLDGVYLPSFNKCFRVNCLSFKKNFKLIGSAHNLQQIRIKEKQKVNKLFISSVFKKKNTFLGLNKFKNLSKFTKIPIIALGGINQNNLNKLNLLDIEGFAAIRFFKNKKKGPPKGPSNF